MRLRFASLPGRTQASRLHRHCICTMQVYCKVTAPYYRQKHRNASPVSTLTDSCEMRGVSAIRPCTIAGLCSGEKCSAARCPGVRLFGLVRGGDDACADQQLEDYRKRAASCLCQLSSFCECARTMATCMIHRHATSLCYGRRHGSREKWQSLTACRCWSSRMHRLNRAADAHRQATEWRHDVPVLY